MTAQGDPVRQFAGPAEGPQSPTEMIRSMALSSAELWHDTLQRLAEMQEGQILIAQALADLGAVVGELATRLDLLPLAGSHAALDAGAPEPAALEAGTDALPELEAADPAGVTDAPEGLDTEDTEPPEHSAKRRRFRLRRRRSEEDGGDTAADDGELSDVESEVGDALVPHLTLEDLADPDVEADHAEQVDDVATLEDDDELETAELDEHPSLDSGTVFAGDAEVERHLHLATIHDIPSPVDASAYAGSTDAIDDIDQPAEERIELERATQAFGDVEWEALPPPPLVTPPPPLVTPPPPPIAFAPTVPAAEPAIALAEPVAAPVEDPAVAEASASAAADTAAVEPAAVEPAPVPLAPQALVYTPATAETAMGAPAPFTLEPAVAAPAPLGALEPVAAPAQDEHRVEGAVVAEDDPSWDGEPVLAGVGATVQTSASMATEILATAATAEPHMPPAEPGPLVISEDVTLISRNRKRRLTFRAR